jgi:hypothetical protein
VANRRFVFCRFCHFRVLTGKNAGHITRPIADAERVAAPLLQRNQERAEVLPGNRKNSPVPKI